MTFYFLSAYVLDSEQTPVRTSRSLLHKVQVDFVPAGFHVWLMKWDLSKSFSNPLCPSSVHFPPLYYWFCFLPFKLYFSEKSQFPLAFRLLHPHSMPGFSKPSAFLMTGVLTTLWQITQHLPRAGNQLFSNNRSSEIQFTTLQFTHSQGSEEISPPINDLPV